MKSKNIKKRLLLNKKTIVDLNGNLMEHLKGGNIDPRPCLDTYLRSGCPSGITCPSICSLGGACC